ncbi:helix-turn-helix domain-containing protein [Blastococcus capsensis]|uniref:helix-turn-helix domain-containing protein n=1 Tax=Blastococcus capsensis TaxID=1564163 RepID=UPI003D6A60C5
MPAVSHGAVRVRLDVTDVHAGMLLRAAGARRSAWNWAVAKLAGRLAERDPARSARPARAPGWRRRGWPRGRRGEVVRAPPLASSRRDPARAEGLRACPGTGRVRAGGKADSW